MIRNSHILLCTENLKKGLSRSHVRITTYIILIGEKLGHMIMKSLAYLNSTSSIG
jgi:hypothetical protein